MANANVASIEGFEVDNCIGVRGFESDGLTSGGGIIGSLGKDCAESTLMTANGSTDKTGSSFHRKGVHSDTLEPVDAETDASQSKWRIGERISNGS